MSNYFGLVKAAASARIGGGTYGSYADDVLDMHKVMISMQSDDQMLNNIRILAHSPQQIDMQIQASWSDRKGNVGDAAGAVADMKGAISGKGGGRAGIGGAAVKAGMNGQSLLTGISQYNRILTAPLWDGGCELSIPLELEFHATADPMSEVVIPTFLLLAAAAPYTLTLAGIPTGQLHAPGPTLLSEATEMTSGDIINISIGNALQFKRVIIENASASILARYESNGLPIATKVNITFRSYFCVTRQDLAEWFKLEHLVAADSALTMAVAAAAKAENAGQGSSAVLA